MTVRDPPIPICSLAIPCGVDGLDSGWAGIEFGEAVFVLLMPVVSIAMSQLMEVLSP